jgi:GT2 family glycosyltransferase
MDLSIIIVTYNNEKEIKACLDSVFLAAAGLKTEIFVIDNASNDGTVARAAEFLKINLIKNGENIGFAAAVNMALKKSVGRHILLLNPDTVVFPDSFVKMILRLDAADGKMALAGGKILNSDLSVQPSVRRFPGFWDQAAILTKMHRFFPTLIARHLCADFDYEKEQTADQIRGAYFWITRDAFNKLGLFDEKNFFIWFEEVDYCRRAAASGIKIIYYPASRAIHAGGVSFGQQLSLKKQRWFVRSQFNYFKKHKNVLLLFPLGVLAAYSVFLAAIVQLFKIKPQKYV